MAQSVPNLTRRRPRTGAWAFAAIPLITFGLGTWQVQRLQRKKAFLQLLDERINGEPVELPDSPDECLAQQYSRVTVEGTYDHSKEMHVLPRLSMQTNDHGALVVTPLKRADNGQWILVNRGWVPWTQRASSTRPKGQVPGTVRFKAVIRGGEKGGQFVPPNRPDKNEWYWTDLQGMAEAAGTQPIMVDACEDATPPSGIPLGGQTRVNVRNTHLEYIITWYSLSAITTFMTYRLLRR
eukprot:comp10622_c0_seq1/m.5317 comp10622_c0_seq1/g.5317  ORF comp10622_c0_seq1/g.5317 comp10622_c0_seq1/m.5317 type:complete len:238 (-) comp10622_c0_seq1:251-964(-)